MEFACSFVYVPPSLSQKGRRHNVNAIERSALLPPVTWVHPRTPPPSPPTNSRENKSPKSSPQLEKSREAKGVASSISVAPQQTSPPRRAALLPPHMRPAAISHLPNHSESFTCDRPVNGSDLDAHLRDPNYSYCTPEGIREEVKLPAQTAVPPRPQFMRPTPDYLMVLPSSSSSQPSTGATGNEDLPGNPNVVLVSLGKLLSDDRALPTDGKPTICTQCGSVLNSLYDSAVAECCFCRASAVAGPPGALGDYPDALFSLDPDENPPCTADALLIFCIDVSGSMSLTSEVNYEGNTVHKSRLQFVQEAVLQCLERLSEQQPDMRVGLITFNSLVTIHGYDEFTSRFLRSPQLNDTDYVKNAARRIPSPPPLSQTKGFLQKQVRRLSESGPTALGPAALLAITMASRQPGSKVIICTDGKANTDLGNLEVEDNDARTLLSSTIFYQELGEYAANQGVTVSVLTIEGTDCRLDELGRLADRSGGNVVIASPNRLHAEFEQIIENRTIATQCTVTLLLPRSLSVRGEKESGSKCVREVGNVDPDKEITFQFGANEVDAAVMPPSSGSHVPIQLQIRYRRRNGRVMLRVITSDRCVTGDSSAVLSSLSVAIVQLNSAQASATLAVRGRFLQARREGELQRKLIQRAIEHSRSMEDEHTYHMWVKTMEPFYSNTQNYTRRNSVISDTESLTDTGAALLYTMKHINRKSISWKKSHQHFQISASTFYIGSYSSHKKEGK